MFAPLCGVLYNYLEKIFGKGNGSFCPISCARMATIVHVAACSKRQGPRGSEVAIGRHCDAVKLPKLGTTVHPQPTAHDTPSTHSTRTRSRCVKNSLELVVQGHRNFAHGDPFHITLAEAVHDGQPILAIVHRMHWQDVFVSAQPCFGCM